MEIMEILTIICLIGVGIAFLTEGRVRSRRSKHLKKVKAQLSTLQEGVAMAQAPVPPAGAVPLPAPESTEPEPEAEDLKSAVAAASVEEAQRGSVPVPQATGAMMKMPPPLVPGGRPAPAPVGTGALPQSPSQRFATAPKSRKKSEESDTDQPQSAEALAAMMVLEMQKELRRNFWRGIFKDIVFFALGVATPFAINAIAGSN
ncbi:MAG: hypothetical protein AAF585_03090 [Verrucomicrobiota bacterium]